MFPRLPAAALTAILSIAAMPGWAADCGGAEVPCETHDGSYHLRLPEAGTPEAIVVDLHGGGGTGKGMLRSGFSRAVIERGYLYVAPNGEHPEARWTRDWSVRANNMSHLRDDKVFLANGCLATGRGPCSVTMSRVRYLS